MANRFLETNYYKSSFVRGLKGALKGLYSFIICDCTPAGIWNKDIEAASMYIGFVVTDEEFNNAFVLTGKAIDIGRGKYFFPDFIEHQYPKGLQETNVAHKNIIYELQKIDILDDNLQIKRKKNEGALKGLQSPQGIGIGNGIGNVMVKDKVKVKEEILQKKTFNTNPIAANFNGLPENYIINSIELVRITAQSTIDEHIVLDMWNIFKNQKLTGSEYYANEGKVYSHFLDWIKKQKFTNGTKSQPNNFNGVTKFNAGALDLLSDIKGQTRSTRS